MNGVLYRSNKDRVIGGICGGIGDYLGVDVTIVRILFVIFSITSGFGFIVYLILWFFLPRENYQNSTDFSGNIFREDALSRRVRTIGNEMREAFHSLDSNIMKYVGLGLVISGVFMIIDRLNIRWLLWLNGDVIWAVILIIAGGALLWRTLNRKV